MNCRRSTAICPARGRLYCCWRGELGIGKSRRYARWRKARLAMAAWRAAPSQRPGPYQPLVRPWPASGRRIEQLQDLRECAWPASVPWRRVVYGSARRRGAGTQRRLIFDASSASTQIAGPAGVLLALDDLNGGADAPDLIETLRAPPRCPCVSWRPTATPRRCPAPLAIMLADLARDRLATQLDLSVAPVGARELRGMLDGMSQSEVIDQSCARRCAGRRGPFFPVSWAQGLRVGARRWTRPKLCQGCGSQSASE